jgi:ribosomal protein L37AE/L43A
MTAKEQVEKLLKEQKDGETVCPRCGLPLMSERLHTNALSRQADVYVCNMCGMDEALRAMTKNILPFEEWDIMKKGTP